MSEFWDGFGGGIVAKRVRCRGMSKKVVWYAGPWLG